MMWCLGDGTCNNDNCFKYNLLTLYILIGEFEIICHTCSAAQPGEVLLKINPISPQKAVGLKSEVAFVTNYHKTSDQVALKQRVAYHCRGLSRQVQLYVSSKLTIGIYL